MAPRDAIRNSAHCATQVIGELRLRFVVVVIVIIAVNIIDAVVIIIIIAKRNREVEKRGRD